MSPKPSNSPLPNSGVLAGGGGDGVKGVVVAGGVGGTLEVAVAVGPPGVLVVVGPPGVLVAVAVGPPGVFEAVAVVVGPTGVFVVVGPPGVFVAVGPPDVLVVVGPPGVLVAVGPPGVFVDVGVGVMTASNVLRLSAVVLVGVSVAVSVDTRTGAVSFWLGRALCVVPAEWGVDVACGAGVARPVGAQGVMAPVGAVGSPAALVGRGVGVRHGATVAFAAGAACLCDVRARASRPLDDAGFNRTTALYRPVWGRAMGIRGAVTAVVADVGATVDAATDGADLDVGIAVDVDAADRTAREGVHAIAAGAGA